MSNEIKAIETSYKGYRFRSRLEARWAVFLDTLGVKWEYEKEGYDLGEAGWYLPDFWLPELGAFLEIKPNADTSTENFNKFSALCSVAPIIVSTGGPNDQNEPYSYVLERDGDTGEPRVRIFYWACTDRALGLLRWSDGAFLWRGPGTAFKLCGPDFDSRDIYHVFCHNDAILEAIVAFRSARFEHVEGAA